MCTIMPSRIGCKKIGHARKRVADLSLPWIVFTGGRSLPDVRLWIHGFRIITSQAFIPFPGRDSMMALTVNAARIAVIVAAATSMSIFAVPLQTLFAAQGDGSLGSAIGGLVAGGYSPVSQIDRNMAATQMTLAAIDTVQVPPGDTENADAKAHASLMAGFGAASPPMAAGAMLLLYQFTIAIFIGLGPLFILCLIFDQTKDLFRRWLMYGIGTLFSIATLCLVSSIMLKLVENVAVALWSADLINNFLGQGTEGFSSRALEQGGIGLMMTVLIVSVPPLTANFFQGTMGNFLFQSAFGMGGARASKGCRRGLMVGVAAPRNQPTLGTPMLQVKQGVAPVHTHVNKARLILIRLMSSSKLQTHLNHRKYPMKACHWLWLGLLMPLFSASHAQTACPPGMEEYGAGVCGYSQSEQPPQQQQMQSQLPTPPTRWLSRWGAIATDGPGGHFGAATDLSSKNDAKQTALTNCKTKGGENCQIETWYSNGCAAMVVGDKGHNSNNATTLHEAIQKGMKTCSATDLNCHVYYSACSQPLRVQ